MNTACAQQQEIFFKKKEKLMVFDPNGIFFP